MKEKKHSLVLLNVVLLLVWMTLFVIGFISSIQEISLKPLSDSGFTTGLMLFIGALGTMIHVILLNQIALSTLEKQNEN